MKSQRWYEDNPEPYYEKFRVIDQELANLRIENELLRYQNIRLRDQLSAFQARYGPLTLDDDTSGPPEGHERHDTGVWTPANKW